MHSEAAMKMVVPNDGYPNSERIVDLCAEDDVKPGEIGRATLPNGTAVAIYNVDGNFFVTDDRCTHGDASLSEDGMLIGHTVECSWHFGTFDVRSGAATGSPCEAALRTYSVLVENGRVAVRADVNA